MTTRIALNLATIGGLAWMIWYSRQLFTHQVPDPLQGSLILLGGLVGWVLFLKLALNRYRRTFPSFKFTVFALLCVAIVFAFAGVEPMSNYKDAVATKWGTYQLEQEAKQVAKEAAEQAKQAEAEAVGVSKEYDFYVEYIALFNNFRKEQGLPPLIANPQLNELATKRAIEISQPGNFSHAGIKAYNLGENIAMTAYSSDSPSTLVNLWATSPGHRANMLDRQYRSTGFAKNGRYAVQLFD